MTVSMRSRSNKTSRQPLNRSRSGDGLARVGRRNHPKRRTPLLAVLVVFLFLVILVAVATVHNSMQGNTLGNIRKRQLQKTTRTEEEEQYYQSHNSDEAPAEDVDVKEFDGGRYPDPDESEDGGVLGDIQANEKAMLEENKAGDQQDEQIRRDEEAERAKEREIQKLKEEKARLEQQLQEEEERRRKEEDLRRQQEEEAEERKLEEEERQKEFQLQQLELEKLKLQQQLKEDELKKQEKEEEQMKQQREEEDAQDAAESPEQQDEDSSDNLPGLGNQLKIDFCDFMRSKPDIVELNAAAKNGFSNPGILLLGVEDTSTDLFWHVISQILHPGRGTARKTQEIEHQVTKTMDYTLLNSLELHRQNQFWESVSDNSHGKWMVHVMCQQQEHDIPAGFPWITSPNAITGNEKARETIELIKQLPKGSVKILRIKRNLLDVAIRHAQLEQRVSKGEPVELDRRKIFKDLHRLQSEQDEIDNFLHDSDIPHLTIDFESLFPFDEWTNLVQNTQEYQLYPMHINVDWRQLATQLEATWRDVLRYVDIFRPLSMYDILHYAMQTHEAHSFWTQKHAVKTFGYIERALQGTHYQPFLRKDRPALEPRREIDDEEMRHDLL